MTATIASSTQDAFWTVLLIVVIGGAVVAVFTFLGTGKLYDQIGRGGLSLREEIRQLVVARNERRARAGKEPLDVDAEVERQVRELSG